MYISIHALLAESDGPQGCYTLWEVSFLSTLSLRRATEQSASYNAYLAISIHALLAESDLILHMAHLIEHLFLSTLSLRRATVGRY